MLGPPGIRRPSFSASAAQRCGRDRYLGRESAPVRKTAVTIEGAVHGFLRMGWVRTPNRPCPSSRRPSEFRLIRPAPVTPANFPPNKSVADRRRRLRTLDTCQRPPRAVRTPRSLSALASPRKSARPFDRSEFTMGSTLAANASASAVMARCPTAAASAGLRRLPSFAPCALRAAGAAFVRSEISRRSFSAKAA